MPSGLLGWNLSVSPVREASMNLKQCAVVVAFMAVAGTAQAHGGRLNSQGCHNDRVNGGYHCHGGSSVSSRSAVPSVYTTVPTRPQAERPVQIQEEPRVRSAPSSKREPQVPQIYYPSASQPAAAQTGTPQFFLQQLSTGQSRRQDRAAHRRKGLPSRVGRQQERRGLRAGRHAVSYTERNRPPCGGLVV